MESDKEYLIKRGGSAIYSDIAPDTNVAIASLAQIAGSFASYEGKKIYSRFTTTDTRKSVTSEYVYLQS